MTPYFDKDTIPKLRTAVEGWLGTPYFHAGSSKHGTDCAKFIGLILLEVGILRDIQIEKIHYARDWHVNGQKQLIIDSFLDHGEKYLVDGLSMDLMSFRSPGEVCFGDILFMAAKGLSVCNHAGVYMGNNNMVHCLENCGVYMTKFHPHWSRCTKKFLRIIRGN